VFIHFNESSVDNDLRRSQTFCKECDAYAWFRLVERVRTVELYWVIKSRERKHFLICGACKAQFLVKEHNKGDIEQADIHTLLGMSGGRHVPFMTRFLIFFATITVWIPVLNLLLPWVAWRERALMPPDWTNWLKYLWWASLAVNTAFVLSLVVGSYVDGSSGY
jgi:hypothetical protein